MTEVVYVIITTLHVTVVMISEMQGPWRRMNETDIICLWTLFQNYCQHPWGTRQRSHQTTGGRSRRTFTSDNRDHLWNRSSTRIQPPVIMWPKFHIYRAINRVITRTLSADEDDETWLKASEKATKWSKSICLDSLILSKVCVCVWSSKESLMMSLEVVCLRSLAELNELWILTVLGI